VVVPTRLPIVQAPMAGGPSTPQLVAAAAAAGALGVLAGGYLSADALEQAWQRTRELTPAPLGVNLFLPTAPDGHEALLRRYAAQLEDEAARLGVDVGTGRWDDDDYPAKLEVVLAVAPAQVSFTFGCPDVATVRRLHAAGSAVAVTATSAADAVAARDAEADTVIVQGTEAGGHQGGTPADRPNTTPLRDLLRRIAPLGLPMVAAGGLASARDIAAAFEAGAGAVQVGTALLCTPEAGTTDVHRRALLDGHHPSTVITRAFSGRWARGLANRFAVTHPDAPRGYPYLHHVTRPLRAAASRQGNMEVPNLWAGTGWRDIRAAPVAEVIAELAAGC
jgi:nitronate monooxygenase